MNGGMTSQSRVQAGVPAGGQFAATPRLESTASLGPPGPTTPLSHERRFETSRSGRSAPPVPYRHDHRYFQERRDAASHLERFRRGDIAVVTDEQGREFVTEITGPSWTIGHSNPGISASLGTGRYTFAVDAHRLATGAVGIRRATPEETTAFQVRP